MEPARGRDGDKARSEAARSAAAATCGAALPWPPQDTASTAASAPQRPVDVAVVAASVVAVDGCLTTVAVVCVGFAAANQNRWIVPSC